MLDIENIMYDIEHGTCVLIIGPDLLDYGKKTFFELLCDELGSDNQFLYSIPQLIFAHEELLQLKNERDEAPIRRAVKRYYEKQEQYDNPFKKISHIPFHLILSFFPDTRLKSIFKKQNLPFQYSYQPISETPDPVEEPKRDNPLIYNLLGDLDTSNAIITFDHLFSYLSGIMGDKKLPINIQKTLGKASTFVFLGVHFEKWYVQLLLRIIASKGKEKYTLLRNIDNNDVCTFVARRLELNFIDTGPADFLERLYEECKKRNMLKISYKAKVFISYNHKDKAVVEQIESRLLAEGVEVIRDVNSMAGGQEIEEFIRIIQGVDCVLLVVSENSLLSSYVSKEATTTIDKAKMLYPCYIDKEFLSNDFMKKAEKAVNEKLNDIDEKIRLRDRSRIDDLAYERNLWAEYNHNLPTILRKLNGGLCVSLMPDDFETNIKKVCADILKLKNDV